MWGDCLTVVSQLGSEKRPCVHLSLLTVISAPPCRAEWCQAVQCRSAGANPNMLLLRREEACVVREGPLHLPLRTWCHMKMAQEFPGNDESPIPCIICCAYLLTQGKCGIVRYLQIFPSKQEVSSSSKCKRYIYGPQIYLIWVIHTWVFLIWCAYAFLNGGNSRWLWNF